MRIDAILNLLWFLLGLAALLSAARSSRKRLCLDVIGVALVVAALFPFISATDDLVQIDQARTQQTNQTDNLIRLYQAMETPLAASAPRLFVTLSLILLVFVPFVRTIQRSTPTRTGRAPPPVPSFAA